MRKINLKYKFYIKTFWFPLKMKLLGKREDLKNIFSNRCRNPKPRDLKKLNEVGLKGWYRSIFDYMIVGDRCWRQFMLMTSWHMLNTIITVTILLQYYCWLIITYGDVVEMGMDHTVWCWDVGYQQLLSDFNV